MEVLSLPFVTEETDEDEGSDYEEESTAKTLAVEIEGMQMLT